MTYTVKALGATAICLAIFLIVTLKLKESKQKIKAVSDMISSLKYISDLIAFSTCELSEIIKKASLNAEIGKSFFNAVYTCLNKAENPPVSEAWEKAARRYSDDFALSEKAYEIIKNVGKRIGSMTVEIETENLSHAINELKKEEILLSEEYLKQASLLKKLAAALSAFIVLILI